MGGLKRIVFTIIIAHIALVVLFSSELHHHVVSEIACQGPIGSEVSSFLL